jgi:hypothetical protein
MKQSIEEKSILPEIERIYLEEDKTAASYPVRIELDAAFSSLYKAAIKGPLPFDPRFNAIHWAIAVKTLCDEIRFSYCWMNAYVKYYKKKVAPGSAPSHVNPYVSYFADNCVTRIDSCRDKVALMVWAFFCPFNPEKPKEILDYHKIIERLKYPIKFSLDIRGQDRFLKYLESLQGRDFERVEKYRHYKIHRLEPRIEIYDVRPHHDWPYMFPLLEQKEISRWEKKLREDYPDNQQFHLIRKSCYIKGIPFEGRKVKDKYWGFTPIEMHINSCMIELFKASAGCFRTLRRRKPLRS